MPELSRRRLLQYGGALTGGLALGACSSSSRGANQDGKPADGELRVWDHFAPQKEIEEEVFAKFAKSPGGLPVEHTVFNPAKMGEAMQIAHANKQMPDLHTLAGLDIPPQQLHENGWFHPIEFDEQTRQNMPQESLIEGLTVFDGNLTSFALFSHRQYAALNWFNVELYEKADLDPESPPTAYDDVRAAARAIRRAGGDSVYGWIAPIKFQARLAEQLDAMAQAAGSPSAQGIGLHTGEYVYDSDAYVDAIEFWLAMRQDGTLFPGSTSLDARTARARWATGVAGTFYDGCYCIGVVVKDLAQFAPKMGVGPLPVPDADRPVIINQPPAAGAFWISSQSQHPGEASDLLALLAAPEYMVKMAEAMPAPPANLDAVAEADVHPTYRTAIDFFKDQVFLAPVPVGKNPNVALVEAAMEQASPNLGQIAQGALTGDVADVGRALKQYNDQMTAAREAAIATVKKTGVEVSLDDWTFPDWEPGKDYGAERYT